MEIASVCQVKAVHLVEKASVLVKCLRSQPAELWVLVCSAGQLHLITADINLTSRSGSNCKSHDFSVREGTALAYCLLLHVSISGRIRETPGSRAVVIGREYEHLYPQTINNMFLFKCLSNLESSGALSIGGFVLYTQKRAQSCKVVCISLLQQYNTSLVHFADDHTASYGSR